MIIFALVTSVAPDVGLVEEVLEMVDEDEKRCETSQSIEPCRGVWWLDGRTAIQEAWFENRYPAWKRKCRHPAADHTILCFSKR